MLASLHIAASFVAAGLPDPVRAIRACFGKGRRRYFLEAAMAAVADSGRRLGSFEAIRAVAVRTPKPLRPSSGFCLTRCSAREEKSPSWNGAIQACVAGADGPSWSTMIPAACVRQECRR